MEEEKYDPNDPFLFQKKKEKTNWNMKPYLAIALVIFVLFCCCIAVFFLIYRYNGVSAGWTKIKQVLQPITIGLVLAYLLNPVMVFIERNMLKLLKGRAKTEKQAKKIARTTGTFGALVVFFLIVFLLFEMMVPQLIRSIAGMVNNLPEQAQSMFDWFNGYINSDNQIALRIEETFMQATTYLESWVKSAFLPDIQTYITSLTSGVINVLKVILNIAVGLIVSVYVLMSKEKFVGQSKKVVYALFKPVRGNIIIEIFRKSNEIFGGFITGKILDSAIIGVLCYICLMILHMPYALLVSAIVGLTNVIPFFGPFIGAVPSFIIITLASPIHGLYFLIFILVLQQVDGNIIGPKILGDSTGLTSFWVVFAIMVGGGLFGVAGMVLGVPTFAVIYYLITKLINYCLRQRKLSESTDDYIELVTVDEKTNKMIYPEPKEETLTAPQNPEGTKTQKSDTEASQETEVQDSQKTEE